MKSNPLATRFVAPGRLPWHPQRGQTLEVLRDRLSKRFDYRAAIVGPHGSGKSTLLEHLVPLLGEVVLRASSYGDTLPEHEDAGKVSSNGRAIVWLKLRGRLASQRLVVQSRRLWSQRGSLLVIDGYEQLSRVARGMVLARTQIAGAGLLVTSHRPTWLPTLTETEADPILAQQLLDQLLTSHSLESAERERLLDTARLRTLLDKHDGNLREVFMELYDELER